jgi:hypothetical protein
MEGNQIVAKHCSPANAKMPQAIPGTQRSQTQLGRTAHLVEDKVAKGNFGHFFLAHPQALRSSSPMKRSSISTDQTAWHATGAI